MKTTQKKLWARVLAVALCAALSVTTFAGCGKSSSTSSSSAADTTASAVESTAESTADTKDKSPITLTFFGAQGYAGTYTSGVQDDPVYKAIQDETGVTLDWDMNPTGDKYNAYVASGDLPDIFVLNSVKDVEALIKSGAVLDLSDYVEKDLPDFLKIGQKALQFSKDQLSAGTGKVYFIPGRLSIGEPDSVYMAPVIGFYTRLDWYKEIGSPELKDFDDVVDMAAAIHEKHPTTADGQPTYAFSMWQDWGLWHYTVASGVIRNLVGLPGLSNSVLFYNPNTYEFVNSLDNDNSPVWVDAEMYNKAYRAGLMDPNSFTQPYSQATTAMDNGQVIVQLASWLTPGPNATLAADNPDNPDAGYVSILVDNGEYASSTYSSTGFAEFWCVSSKCKYPERALDVINTMYKEDISRAIQCGVKGDTWDVGDDGKAYLTEKGLTYNSDPDFMTKTGAGKYSNFSGIDVYSRDSNGQFINLMYDPDVLAKTLTPLKQSWLSMYNETSESDLWKNHNGKAGNSAFQNLFPTPSSDISRIDAKVNEYMVTALPKLVMCESDEAFAAQKAQMIQDIQAIDGFDQLLDWSKTSLETTAEAAKKYE